jgi:SAM-dependent methyltransferase
MVAEENIGKGISDSPSGARDALELQPPTARRLRRIRVYQALLGQRHQRILEIGCGPGDLTYALAHHARQIVGVDISLPVLRRAHARSRLWKLTPEQARAISFCRMNGTRLAFLDGSFDRVVSTSVIEHLHPEEIQPHLAEVRRVLKPSGEYLVWCPNGLGHHDDRSFHFSMYSYREWMEKLRLAGFRDPRSTLFNRPPVVDARFKSFLEEILFRSGTKILWSHLGVRNVLLLARK